MKILHLSMADWAEASCGFTAEQEGWAIRLTRIYASREKLLDSDTDNARMMALDGRVWKRAKAFLIDRAGFYLEDGHIKHERIEKEIEAYRDHRAKAVENGKLGGRPRQTFPGLSPDFPRTFAKSLEEVREKYPLSATPVCNKINDITKPSPTPTPSPTPLSEERKSVCDSAQASETNVGHGVIVNCETIRHAAFVISLPAIEMGLVGAVMAKDDIKRQCIAHALQWAAEIESGKDKRSVVPDKIANFLCRTLSNAKTSAEIGASRTAKAVTPLKDFKTQRREADLAILEACGYKIS